MRRAEGVVDVEVDAARQQAAKGGVVLRLAGVEPQVLQQHELVGVDLVEHLIVRLVGIVVDEDALFAQSARRAWRRPARAST